MRYRIPLLLFFLLLCLHTTAGFRFIHIDSNTGLPHHQVEGLAQDRNGNIWMGTRNGLSRYDGYHIKTYHHSATDNHSLSHNFIHALYADSKDRLWVCTETGVCRYRPETDDFQRYDNPHGLIWAVTENSNGKVFMGGVCLCEYDEKADCFKQVPLLDNNFVNCLTADKQGNIFVSTNKSIFIYDASVTKIQRVDPSLYSDFTEGFNVIIPLFYDSRSRLWFGRNGHGVACVDLKTGQQEVYPGNQLSDPLVRVIREDDQHRIFLGTEKGLTIINPDGKIEISRHEYQNVNSLSDNSIFCILFDNEHNAWISTYYGGVDVLMRSNDQFSWQEPMAGPGQLQGRIARMMTEVEPGVMWIATEDGGINIYNTNTKQGSRFSGIPGMGINVYTLYYDRTSREMWIGTRYDGLYRYSLSTHASKHYLRTDGLSSEGITYILRQRNGRLWIGTMAGLRYYDEQENQFKPVEGKLQFDAFVHAMMEDKNGNLWVGTTNYGIYCIDGKSQRQTHYEKGDSSGLTDNYVVCLHQDHEGKIWIGTNNDGLHYFDTKNKRFHKIESLRTLSNSSICSIEEDLQHNLWISTTQGLFKYQHNSKSFVRFSTDDGLPVNQFNVTSSHRLYNGRMAFGTVNGVVAFTPEKVASSKGPFQVHLKNLILNDREVGVNDEDSPLSQQLDYMEKITLTHNQVTSFAIEYGVIRPSQVDNIEYQVWLEGFDKTWRNVGNETKFSGNNLPAGVYTLHIRASNSDEGWEDCLEKSIVIKVMPPFYRSIWAYLIYLLMASAIAYAVWRIIRTRLKAQEDIKLAKMEKEKLEELDKAKFNFFTMVSHELKTPLSLIIAPLKTIAQKDLGEDSRKHIDTALKNTRQMEELISELVTFNKIETDNFTFYLQKGNPCEFIDRDTEQFQTSAKDKGVNLGLELEDNGEEVWFSPAYLERIVNNLLSNALKFTDNGGEVKVKARITGSDDDPYSYLRLDVIDTGIGIAEEEQSHIFEHYYQTKRGYNVNHSGWGIGLAMVKRLTELHKGRIQLKSTLGEGSTFTVWLNVSAEAFPEKNRVAQDKEIVPIEQYEFSFSKLSQPSGSDVREEMPQAGRDTLLVVDDNAGLLEFLSDFFSGKYNVLKATNGKEALAIAREHSVSMVISDVMMPEMDGNELCRELKQSMETSHIPVILLTAKGETEDVVSGFNSGAELYVTKPFDPNILDMQVKNLLLLIKQRQTEIAETRTEDIESTELSELDKKFLTQMNELVDANISNSDFSISDITRGLYVSRTQLHIKMKSLLNMSMGDYIRKKRLDLACRMLREGHNVSETAYATGFSDPNWFSKTFKKHIGVTPSEYVNKPKS